VNEKHNFPNAVATGMNTEQLIALFLVFLMVGSMVAYSATLI
jgi:hypothetical protein